MYRISKSILIEATIIGIICGLVESNWLIGAGVWLGITIFSTIPYLGSVIIIAASLIEACILHEIIRATNIANMNITLLISLIAFIILVFIHSGYGELHDMNSMGYGWLVFESGFVSIAGYVLTKKATIAIIVFLALIILSFIPKLRVIEYITLTIVSSISVFYLISKEISLLTKIIFVIMVVLLNVFFFLGAYSRLDYVGRKKEKERSKEIRKYEEEYEQLKKKLYCIYPEIEKEYYYFYVNVCKNEKEKVELQTDWFNYLRYIEKQGQYSNFNTFFEEEGLYKHRFYNTEFLKVEKKEKWIQQQEENNSLDYSSSQYSYSKNIGTVFLNESNRVENFIQRLKELEKDTPEGVLKNDIKTRIKLEKSGLDGERAVMYHLKKSGMNMYVIHDLNIGSQIDFLIITSKRVYVVECKNWKGNIEITSSGDFYIYENKNKDFIKKRYQSPTSQNEVHLRTVKDLYLQGMSGDLLNRRSIEDEFEKRYYSLVVFTNTACVIDTSKAKLIDYEPVVHIDQLIRRINELDSGVKESMSLKEMKELAEFYLNNNLPDMEKYENEFLIYEEKVNKLKDKIIALKKPRKDDGELEKELRSFRKRISKEKNIKPFFIFNDKSMKELINKRPETKEALLSVEGFGEKKLRDYGEDILKIINE